MGGIKRDAVSLAASSPSASKRIKFDGANGFTKNAGPAAKGFTSSRQSIAADEIKNAKTSAEAHAIQRQLARERKLAKPNAEPTQRAKKLWERLRRKSHVPIDERKTLVEELFSIITGKVKDFVFKHDSVRVIQCALKYATPTQGKEIARELRGSYRELAESRYAKFLVGKVVVVGDEEVRGWVIGEMQGWVRKGIGHPEAGWVLDDIYRGVCSESQKAILLREWYGPEYALQNRTKKEDGDKQPETKNSSGTQKEKKSNKSRKPSGHEATADLVSLLEINPEKRKPTLDHLLQMINSLINKKLTGFTMLHDAMLQYSLAIGTPATSTVANEFLELLKGDEEGDLLKNLAFTASGSRVVCRALAYSSAKDRKLILRVYKDNILTLASDAHGSSVLLAAFESVDDTKMVSKLIYPELLSTKVVDKTQQQNFIFEAAINSAARVPLLYAYAGPEARWLVPPNSEHANILKEVFDLRNETSKKDPGLRRNELAEAEAGFDNILLSTITERAAELVQTMVGCQYISEVLLGTAPFAASDARKSAMRAVASLTEDDPAKKSHISHAPGAGRMLKTLAGGAKFDPSSKSLVPVEPRLGFAEVLYPAVKDHAVKWACGESSFVIENMLRDDGDGFAKYHELKEILVKGKAELQDAAKAGNKGAAAIIDIL